MKLSSILQSFAVILLFGFIIFFVMWTQEEEPSGVLLVAVSVSTLWTCLVLFALAKLLQKISE